MAGYALRQIGQVLVVCLGISFVTFMLLHLTADPVVLMLPPETPKEEMEAFRKRMGFDQPVLTQYVRYLGGAAAGNFGTSFFFKQPAVSLVLERMPATLLLTVSGLGVAILVALPLGLLAAVKRQSALDNLATLVAVGGQAMPIFWFGIMLMIVFAVKLRLLPSSGYGSWRNMVLPSVTLGAYLAPITMRLVRSEMLDVLAQEFVRTARAKGLAAWVVLTKHAFRNAAIPVLTVIGLQFGQLLGGAVVTETVFAWPGVASLAVSSIKNADYPVVQAAVFLLAVLIVLVNLGVDLLIGVIDPRVRVT
jgi:peptide/nickel transport system permease protein